MLKLYDKIFESNKSNILLYYAGNIISDIINDFWIYAEYLSENLDKIPIIKLLNRDCNMISYLYSKCYDNWLEPIDPNEYLTNFDHIDGNPDLFNNNIIYDNTLENINKFKGYEPYEFFDDEYYDQDILESPPPPYKLKYEHIEKYKLYKMKKYFDEYRSTSNNDDRNKIINRYQLNFIDNQDNNKSIQSYLEEFMNNYKY